MIVYAVVMMLCQVSAMVVSWLLPVACCMLKAYKLLHSAVMVVTRRSWYAVRAVVRHSKNGEPMSPVELEEFLVNLLLLVALVVGMVRFLQSNTWTVEKVTESPDSSTG